MSKLTHGIAVGIGFGLGIVAGVLLGVALAFGIMSKAQQATSPRHAVEAAQAIVIADQRLDLIRGQVCILGTMSNAADTGVSAVIIEGSLFDTNTTLLDKQTEYFGHLEPHGTVNFKIGFPGRTRQFPDGRSEIQIGTVVAESPDAFTSKLRIAQGSFEK